MLEIAQLATFSSFMFDPESVIFRTKASQYVDRLLKIEG